AAGAHLIRNGKLGSRYRVHEKGRGIGIPTAIFTNYFNLVYTRWDRNFQYRLVTEVTGYDQVVHFASDIISAGSRTVWKYQSKQSRIRIVTFFRNPMNYVFKLSGRISICYYNASTTLTAAIHCSDIVIAYGKIGQPHSFIG